MAAPLFDPAAGGSSVSFGHQKRPLSLQNEVGRSERSARAGDPPGKYLTQTLQRITAAAKASPLINLNSEVEESSRLRKACVAAEVAAVPHESVVQSGTGAPKRSEGGLVLVVVVVLENLNVLQSD